MIRTDEKVLSADVKLNWNNKTCSYVMCLYIARPSACASIHPSPDNRTDIHFNYEYHLPLNSCSVERPANDRHRWLKSPHLQMQNYILVYTYVIWWRHSFIHIIINTRNCGTVSGYEVLDSA